MCPVCTAGAMYGCELRALPLAGRLPPGPAGGFVTPQSGWAGSPAMPGSRDSSAPASGSEASLLKVAGWRAVVMNMVPRSSPPKAGQVRLVGKVNYVLQLAILAVVAKCPPAEEAQPDTSAGVEAGRPSGRPSPGSMCAERPAAVRRCWRRSRT